VGRIRVSDSFQKIPPPGFSHSSKQGCYDHKQQNTNFLDCILIGIFYWENVLNFHGRKNGGHFERRSAIWRRNTPHHNYIARKFSLSSMILSVLRPS